VLYLVGTNGHPNYGDELIAASWLRWLAKNRPDADVWLDCHTPGQAVHLLGGLHPRLRFTDTLWRLVWQTREMDRAAANEHIDRSIADLGSPTFDIGLLALRTADVVHFLGGGHVNALWPQHLGLLWAGRRIGELTGARVSATGLGLTPLPDEATLKEAFATFAHSSVRDEPSAAVADVKVTADDSCLAFPDLDGFGLPVQPPRGSGDVWVCLQADLPEPEHFEAMVTAVRTALTDGSLEGRTVRYLEALPGSDRAAFERLSDLIPEDNFVPFVKLWHDGFPAAPGQTWITSRFHTHLLAAACGAEGTAVEVDAEYYHVKHQSLLALGTGWSTTPVGSDTLAPPGFSDGFRSKARQLTLGKWREAEAVYGG
jgi:hypothetical protein